MTRDEIDRAVREAQQYASEDNQAREEATAKDILERQIYHAEANKKELSREQKKELHDAVKRTKKALKSRNPQLMTDCAREIESLLA